ncbi:unnamed protein product [Arabis nemorensis]|uniref:DUF4216 domain-containing protein n=1 Tax=Arabis nemorensis TaxID=586526 RepID=A0A565B038_9BRAS|nr:unnamed protein product [Arabis nemorensis]
MRSTYPEITDYQLSVAKQQDFTSCVQADVINTSYLLWLHELAMGSIRQCTCWHKYFSRRVFVVGVRHQKKHTMINSNNCSSYISQICCVAYHGIVTLFGCDWFNTTSGTGTRRRKYIVVEVFMTGTYAQNDPFIQTSRADQVCFFGYPQVNVREDEWLVVVKVSPQGIIDESSKHVDAVQEKDTYYLHNSVVGLLKVPSLVVPGGQLEDIREDPISDNEDDDECYPGGERGLQGNSEGYSGGCAGSQAGGRGVRRGGGRVGGRGGGRVGG